MFSRKVKENVFLMAENTSASHFFVRSKPGCQGDMIYYNGSCLILVTTYKTFDDARAFCQNHYNGSDHVKIGSPSKNLAVSFLGKVNDVLKDLWIGYVKYEKGFAWTQTMKKGGYENWHSGEPNGKGGHGSRGDVNCTLIWLENKYAKGSMTWDDRGCDCKKWSVCETGKLI